MSRGSGGALRRAMVADLEKRSIIASKPVRRAFLAVPREIFLPEHVRESGLAAVYSDRALVTKKDRSGIAISSSSQPAIMARMLELLDLKPGMRVLEIGAGTGYNAALLEQIVGRNGRVDAVDIDSDVAARARKALRSIGSHVRVTAGDGLKGSPERGPYDRIILTVASPKISRAWFDQLTEGGKLELPFDVVPSLPSQPATVFVKERGALTSVAMEPAGFMGLRVRPGAPSPDKPKHAWLGVYEGSAQGSRPIAILQGADLHRIDASTRRDLLGVMTAAPRITAYRGRGDVWQADLFFALTRLDGDLLARFSGEPGGGLALIGPSGEGFAALIATKSKRLRFLAAGDRSVERRMRALVRAWERQGRPAYKDARIRVTFGRTPAGPAWHTISRNGFKATVDWARH